jgi:hypothetical protein
MVTGLIHSTKTSSPTLSDEGSQKRTNLDESTARVTKNKYLFEKDTVGWGSAELIKTARLEALKLAEMES